MKQSVEWYETEFNASGNYALSADELSKEIEKLSDHTRRSILEEAINKRPAKVVTYVRLSVVLGDFEHIKGRANLKAQYNMSCKHSIPYHFDQSAIFGTDPMKISRFGFNSDNISNKVKAELSIICRDNYSFHAFSCQNALTRIITKRLRLSEGELERKKRKRMFLIEDNVEILKERIAKHPLKEQTEVKVQPQPFGFFGFSLSRQQPLSDGIKIFGKERRLIDEAAKYGAIKCFKFLLVNGVKVGQSTLESGFISGNLEIIQLIREQGIECTERCLKKGIKYHHNELVEQIIEEKSVKICNMVNLIAEAHKHNNLQFIIFLRERGMLNETFYQSKSQNIFSQAPPPPPSTPTQLQQCNFSANALIAHYVYETFNLTCSLTDQNQLIQDDDPFYSSFLIPTLNSSNTFFLGTPPQTEIKNQIFKNDSIKMFVALLPHVSDLLDYKRIISYHSVKILKYQREHDTSFADNVYLDLTKQPKTNNLLISPFFAPKNPSAFDNHADSEVLEMLIDAGVKIQTLYAEAAGAESSEPLEYMLSLPDIRENAPDDLLMRAAKHDKFIDSIIEMGFCTKGAFGAAVQSLNVASVEKLVNRQIIDFSEFSSATYIAMSRDGEAMTKYLLSIGWDINQLDEGGSTLLCYSIQALPRSQNGFGVLDERIDFSFIVFLLKNGADPNHLDNSCESPSTIAIEKQSDQLIKLMIRYGAAIDLSIVAELKSLSHEFQEKYGKVEFVRGESIEDRIERRRENRRERMMGERELRFAENRLKNRVRCNIRVRTATSMT